MDLGVVRPPPRAFGGVGGGQPPQCMGGRPPTSFQILFVFMKNYILTPQIIIRFATSLINCQHSESGPPNYQNL
jgi:hypothetical protein